MNILLIAQVTQQSQAVKETAKKIAENSDKFSQMDPSGIGMTLIGMAVVFSSLIILYLLFLSIGKLLTILLEKNKLQKQSKPERKKISSRTLDNDMVNIAIALALHQYFEEIHDYESAILTIQRVTKNYSPWSSKIYGLRQYPR